MAERENITDAEFEVVSEATPLLEKPKREPIIGSWKQVWALVYGLALYVGFSLLFRHLFPGLVPD